jgi:SAM-dependent methyltransferase
LDYEKIVRDVIEEYRDSPIDMLDNGDNGGEYAYLLNLADSYVRTVRDVSNLVAENRNNIRILEIGSFLGAVSISLKNLSFDVTAVDIPEFYRSERLRSHYAKHDITFNGLNLRNSQLPFESNSFDVVVICEVIEHLNFNPLPVLEEINRVLKTSGYIYIGMPNHASLENRLKLLVGRSVHNSIADYFKQLSRNDNMIVGLHWREYTLSETSQLVHEMGFEAIEKYYFLPTPVRKRNLLTKILRKLIYSYQPFRPFHVVIGRKIHDLNYDFWRTEANS